MRTSAARTIPIPSSTIFNVKRFYGGNGKKISQAAFTSRIKSLTKGKKPSSVKYYENTSKNRKKYLK